MFRKKNNTREEINQTIKKAARQLYSAPASCLESLYDALSLDKLDGLTHHSDWIHGIYRLMTEMIDQKNKYSFTVMERLVNQLNALLARVYLSCKPTQLAQAFQVWSSIKAGAISAEDNYLIVKTLWDIKKIDGCVIKNRDAIIANHRVAGLRKCDQKLIKFLQEQEMKKTTLKSQPPATKEHKESKEQPNDHPYFSFLLTTANVLFEAGKNLYHWVHENPKKALLFLVVFNDMFFLNKVAAAEVSNSTTNILMSLPPSFHFDESRLAASTTVSRVETQPFCQSNVPASAVELETQPLVAPQLLRYEMPNPRRNRAT